MRRVGPVPLHRQAASSSRAEGAGRPRARRGAGGRPRRCVRGDRAARARHAAARNDDRRRGRGRADGGAGADRGRARGLRAQGPPDPSRRAGRCSRRDERSRASRDDRSSDSRRRGGRRRVARPRARSRGTSEGAAGGARVSARPCRRGEARQPARRPVRRAVARCPRRRHGGLDPCRRGASRDRRRPQGAAPVAAQAALEGRVADRDGPARRVDGRRRRRRAGSSGSSTFRGASGSATPTRRSRRRGCGRSSGPSPRTAASR